jgi:hypothetical protein
VAGHCDDSAVVLVAAVNLDVEPRLGEVVGEASAPLNQRDASLEVDVEVVELGRAAEAIGVNVNQWCFAACGARRGLGPLRT